MYYVYEDHQHNRIRVHSDLCYQFTKGGDKKEHKNKRNWHGSYKTAYQAMNVANSINEEIADYCPHCKR